VEEEPMDLPCTKIHIIDEYYPIIIGLGCGFQLVVVYLFPLCGGGEGSRIEGFTMDE